jgi:hypothetical protein
VTSETSETCETSGTSETSGTCETQSYELRLISRKFSILKSKIIPHKADLIVFRHVKIILTDRANVERVPHLTALSASRSAFYC